MHKVRVLKSTDHKKKNKVFIFFSLVLLAFLTKDNQRQSASLGQKLSPSVPAQIHGNTASTSALLSSPLCPVTLICSPSHICFVCRELRLFVLYASMAEQYKDLPHIFAFPKASKFLTPFLSLYPFNRASSYMEQHLACVTPRVQYKL